MTKRKTMVGGQAVIEGVMMRGKECIATSVRKNDGEIVTDKKYSVPFTKRNKILSLPIIRGFVVLIDSMITGIQTLNYSASFFEEEDEEPSIIEKFLKKIFKDKASDIIMGFSLIIAIFIAVGLFFVLPTVVANFFKSKISNNAITLNIIEGIIRVIIFILYIYSIGKLEDIERVYEYHGAEHKSIFCYESGEELTPENASKFSRFHPRCGTNFLFLVMIISILIFSLTGWKSIWIRILYRVILLPVISGITYEIVRWLGKSNNKMSKILAYPGLQLQKLTTREPNLEQLEVAITALKIAEGIHDEIC